MWIPRTRRGDGLALALACLALMLAWSSPAGAQMVPAPPPLNLDQRDAGPLPRALEDVGVEERLNEQVPLDLSFVDETGKAVRLGDYFQRGKPVLLNLGYFECPMLCGLIWQGLTESLSQLKWTPGGEFDIVTVSFDPTEGAKLAQLKKKNLVKALGRPGADAGWHVLTGDEASIRRLTEAVGFRYRWVESQQQFAHPAVLIVLTPEGKVSRYVNGINPDPGTVRLALLEASDGKIGGPIDWFVHQCFVYDPASGSYTLAAINLMRLGGAVTLVVLVLVIGGMLLKEARACKARAREQAPAAAPDASQ